MPNLQITPSVYLETSFISYLTGPISQNIITAANQHITREWWEQRRTAFDLFVSPMVIDEVSQGATTESAKRLAILNDIPTLEPNDEIKELALAFLQQRGIPRKSAPDAYHIAVATVYKINYLLTWNCKHIANVQIHPKLRQISLKRGYELPTLCTPYELLSELEE